MLQFFGAFTQSFATAVALWPLAASVLTLPLLLMHYIRFRRVSVPRALMTYALVLYGLSLVLFTLYPVPHNPVRFCAHHQLQPQLVPLESILDIRTEGLRAGLQVGMNLLFFVPLGVFVRSMYRWRWYWAVGIGFVVSALIETAQLTGAFGIYPCSYRLFDVDDLLINTSGALLGYGLGRFFPNLRDIKRGQAVIRRPGLVRRMVTFVVDMLGVNIVVVVTLMVIYALQRGNVADLSQLRELIFWPLVVLTQFILPLLWQGYTLAGRLTGITLDSQQRGWLHRLIFYLARLEYVVLCLSGRSSLVVLMVIVSIITWQRYHQLPYGLVDVYWGKRRGKAGQGRADE